jgi:hypothetical protein
MPEQTNTNASGNTQGFNFPKNYGPSKPNGPYVQTRAQTDKVVAENPSLGPVIKEHYDNGLWHRK